MTRILGLFVFVQGAIAAEVFVLNRGTEAIELKKIDKKAGTWIKLQPGQNWKGSKPARYFGDDVNIGLVNPALKIKLPKDRYAVVVVKNGEFVVHDANELQVELSAAAKECTHGSSDWEECLARGTYGGFPEKSASAAFIDLWGSHSFWHTCTMLEPHKPLRTITSKGGYKVDIIREEPMVATVRGFVKPEVCQSILKSNDIDSLTRAHTGGTGGTATSESRETLTTNFFVEWNKKTAFTVTMARKFDLVSDLFGKEFSYEGQEPVNFLHYLKGYEYRPHTDGSGGAKGKRVATTLTYCEAADDGGATVFTNGEPIRFQPGNGDLLYFAYNTKWQLSTHAACPVVAGNKTTLTQWYRPDVGPTEKDHWDNFENWGKFHNPHIATRWKGERYGSGQHDFEL